MTIRVRGIPSDEVDALRAGGADANGQVALQIKARGRANPCRHCLQLIEDGAAMLVLCYRPFQQLQPYAESGPIFLHGRDCPQYDSDRLPEWIAHLQPALVRGYDTNDWIRYESARVVDGAQIGEASARILDDPAIGYVHVRSKFNCFQCRIERG